MSPSPRTGTGGEATKGPRGLRLTVTVVICTRGQAPTLLDALRSATSELDDGDDALVLVDGGPLRPDDSVAVAEIARVVTQPTAGLAAARQRAVDRAVTDLVLFMDDDEIARPGWRAALARAFADERVGAAGGTILARWPRGTPPAWLHRELRPAFGERVAGPECSYLPFGGNLAVRRSAALAVGGFSSALGHTPARPGLHEDAELCLRLARAGWKVEEAPDAVVEHLVRPDQVRLTWVLRRAWHQGRSDARMARLSGDRDGLVRTAKLTGLAVAAPIAAVRPRTGAFVAARLLVNLGYLWDMAISRRATDTASVDGTAG